MHQNYPHEAGQLPGCPACDSILGRREARATIARTERQIGKHLSTCTVCNDREGEWCDTIQATAREWEETTSLIDALDELKTSTA